MKGENTQHKKDVSISRKTVEFSFFDFELLTFGLFSDFISFGVENRFVFNIKFL